MPTVAPVGSGAGSGPPIPAPPPLTGTAPASIPGVGSIFPPDPRPAGFLGPDGDPTERAVVASGSAWRRLSSGDGAAAEHGMRRPA
jgi:hypothetical protein